MGAARSLLAEQLWSDKDAISRDWWFTDHGDRIARAEGQLVSAIEFWAREVKATGAHEGREFSCEEHLNDMLDRSRACLAPEVKAWLEG